MAYAKGKYAYGYCQRSGDKVPYKELVHDRDNPGLLVQKSWRDDKNPQDKSPRIVEGISLRRNSPDRDDDTVGDDTLLVDALGFTSYFGGTT